MWPRVSVNVSNGFMTLRGRFAWWRLRDVIEWRQTARQLPASFRRAYWREKFTVWHARRPNVSRRRRSAASILRLRRRRCDWRGCRRVWFQEKSSILFSTCLVVCEQWIVCVEENNYLTVVGGSSICIYFLFYQVHSFRRFHYKWRQWW